MNNKVTIRSVAALGSIEIFEQTPFIDFHYNNSNSDYTARICEYEEGRLTFNSTNGINIATDKSLQVNLTNVSLANHNHDTRYPRIQSGQTNVKCLLGTKVLTALSTQYSQQLFSFAELKDMFGVSSCSMANTACFVSNGDWTANECQVTAFIHTNGWHVGFTSNISGSVRINYLVIYFA